MELKENNLQRALSQRQRRLEGLVRLLLLITTYSVLGCVAFIIGKILWDGGQTVFIAQFPFLNLDFLFGSPETLHIFEWKGIEYAMGATELRAFLAEHELHQTELITDTLPYAAGGIFPAVVGTVMLTCGSMAIALLLGVLSAIYLSEFAREGRFIRLVRLSIMNLAGVPSIVFGLFGLGMFVLFLGFGQSMLAGWFTLAIMVLPVVITASEESLRAVPRAYREAALSVGATRWQSVRHIVLPHALPGILTSSILGIARVAGETAPIMFTAAFAFRDLLPWEVSSVSEFITQGVMALPYHIYLLSSKLPQSQYTSEMQYGTAFVFLCVVGLISLGSIFLRYRLQSRG